MIKVGIIGVGAIAHTHIKAYLNNINCKIVAVVNNVDKAITQKVLDQYDLNCPIYQTIAKMIENENIDLVSICTPPSLHKQMIVECLDAKLHVIVEKPMGTSIEECDQIIEAVKRNNKILSPIAQSRFTNPMFKIKKLLESGLLGKVNYIMADSNFWRGRNYYDLYWRGTWKDEGGGCTLIHAIHLLDLILWMNGMPKSINANMFNLNHTNAEIEDLSISVFKYDNSIARFTATTLNQKESQSMTFLTENASVSIPIEIKAVREKENGFPEDNLALEEKLRQFYNDVPNLENEAHQGQINDVLDSIINNQKPLINEIDGRNAIEIIMAIYKSSTLNCEVILPITKKDPFYTKEGVVKNVKYFYKKTASKEAFTSNQITIGSDNIGKK